MELLVLVVSTIVIVWLLKIAWRLFKEVASGEDYR